MNVNQFHDPANHSAEQSPRFGDVLQFIGGALGGATKAGLRRLFRGPLRKAWGWKLEVIIGLQGGTYDLLAKIGPVRYQRVLEKLLTKIDGGGATITVSDSPQAPGHWFLPPQDNGSVILYFHGGGYVYGSAKAHGPLMGAIACAASARVLALDYRLAPEHPQPAAIEDACTAFRHLVASGISPSRIVFAGDSAGGGLVVSALLSLQSTGDKLPAAGVGISPWLIFRVPIKVLIPIPCTIRLRAKRAWWLLLPI